jgi:uroporphyrinogen decarboxylase
MKPFLIKHLDGESQNRFPVWMMRQAGRYLSSYRAVRKEHSFWEMVTLPEVTTAVTLQPVEQLDVDAAILFSDILTLPFGLGLPVEMREGVGPVVTTPLRTLSDFNVFENFSPGQHTAYVSEALSMLRAQLPKEKALLGFCGAPWTVGCYLIEGEPDREFEQVQRWMYRDPQGLQASLALLAQASSRYLLSQIQSGADLVQIFDTWLCLMPRWFFTEFYLPILKQMVSDVQQEGGRVSFYTKNAGHLADVFVDLGVDLISVDSLLSLSEYDRVFGGKVSLQGNLSPRALLTDVPTVRREAKALRETARTLSRPAILNLGHGILPGTPMDNVRAFIDEARSPWT